MINNRENIINKVRAIWSKTVDNGCTEAEAMAALSIAQKMMEEHAITEDDLKLEDEKAIIGGSGINFKDPQNIRWELAAYIGKFTETKPFGNKKAIKFAGLKSDVDFAIWLCESLTNFVRAQLKSYMWANGFQKLQGNERTRVINSFVRGCCARINGKLKQLIDARKVTTNSTALVVAKQALIADAIKDLNIGEESNKGRKRVNYSNVYRDGAKAGDKASFGRPVETGGMLRIGK